MSGSVEIQTCTNYRGDGLRLHEIMGGTRHRWHCLDCDEKGPAEMDGAVCREQFKHHVCNQQEAAMTAPQPEDGSLPDARRQLDDVPW